MNFKFIIKEQHEGGGVFLTTEKKMANYRDSGAF